MSLTIRPYVGTAAVRPTDRTLNPDKADAMEGPMRWKGRCDERTGAMKVLGVEPASTEPGCG
jgi:hypothetical protein